MDDCGPKYFEYLRKQLLAIPPDSLRRIDVFRMRVFALEALQVCEALTQQLVGKDPELYPDHAELLQLRLEAFPT